uniref:NAD(P)-binding domain-containing protein n=1 Tax=Helicotheca tamesis TaxID=374047 RepID=A0A7S2H613_9STRA|mmetsp:Transcript_1555/g.2225  ORF Transcript_1555/g.2225 Transcript_1555/m.2225 type:complete len:295 (+) Transcript_1555:166-1050(+)|eukprot:CAMPEP_0185729250 /NCGR_PEP_ID=MMETSP1171-20130828/4880_1 /TAXON_ID=374046 /ORGANISM="Helicotheca tamensis, Strain CCMP826" /LENGTH=294 /DNA_ID=CAMNT_0028398045 /DNA_START=117 /DNA_END=1001 /DNA_ORIENTATION=-
MKSFITICLALSHPSSGFLNGHKNNISKFQDQTHNAVLNTRTSLCMSKNDNTFDRRSLLSNTGKLIPAAAFFAWPFPTLADDDSKGKIVVFGGSGYVGAHVSQILSSKGYNVVSVSRKSPSDQVDKVSQILGASLTNVDYQSADAINDDLSSIVNGATAVVSCVGVTPGGPNQIAGNGVANVRIVDAAKAAGIDRFVYISVDSALSSGPAKFVLGDYFKGKAQAEAAVTKGFDGEKSLVIKPGIIAGAPPGEIRPPGPPGSKAVSVDAVAKAVVAGVVGEKSGVIDGNAAIESL